jgi:hypothetical protein
MERRMKQPESSGACVAHGLNNPAFDSQGQATYFMEDRKMNHKKIFRILTVLFAIVLSAISVASGYSGGTGDPETPYQIATRADLLELAATPTDYDKYFILTADIDMEGQVFTTAIIAPDMESSKGFQGTAFIGKFDGDGYKIHNFTINGGSGDYIGLFGYIDSDGEVNSLGLESFATSGDDDVGGLVGRNDSYDSSINNCYSIGTANGTGYNVGGLVGSNNGSVSNCYSNSNVSGDDYVGGLVGSNGSYGNIGNCYSTGSVSGDGYVGGLVGRNYNSVSGSFWDMDTSGQTTSNGGEGKTTAQMHDINTYLSAGWHFVGYSTNDYWIMPSGGGYPVLSAFYPLCSGGSGTAGDPYRIANKDDLLTIAANMTVYHRCFILTSDIDLQGHFFTTAIIAPDTNSISSYFQGTTFKGTFDGDGYKIYNFSIYGDEDYIGLFGFIDSGSEVKNLGLENYTVEGGYYVGGLSGVSYNSSINNCYSTGNVHGYDYSVGGLVGLNNYGDISNCCSTGYVSGSYGDIGALVGVNHGYIWDCNSTGTVSGTSNDIGGLAGSNFGSVSNCYSNSNVSSNGDNVGGLIGFNDGSISSCYSTGSVDSSDLVGGLVGKNSGSIGNCYSNGNVSGDNEVGGLVGRNGNDVNNCYSVGIVSGDYAGGLVGCTTFGGSVNDSFWDTQTSGQTTSDGGIGKTTAEMQDVNTFLAAGWDFVGETANGTNDYWIMPVGWYPLLSTDYKYSGGTGTIEWPYRIANKDDLMELAATTDDYGKYFVLTEDINLQGQVFTAAIIAPDANLITSGFQGTYFTGKFDGKDYKITNFTITGGSNDFIGLFGAIASGGLITNLGLDNFTISGDEYVGGLAGHSGGSIISNCYSTGDISGSNYYVGGLSGYNNGGILDCYSTGNVSGANIKNP